MRKTSPGTFYCFSPPVMIATIIIEVGLAIYSVLRYKFNRLTQLIVILLLLLATFQLAEFQVCTGQRSAILWARMGYMAITLLPPLGIQIVSNLRFGRTRRNPVVYAAYTSAAFLVLFFALNAQSIEGQRCLGNYVFFQLNSHFTALYGLYYYGWVLVGAFLAVWYSQSAGQRKQRRALYGFAAGYAAFLVPTTTVNLVYRATREGIPSIMCGFAVLLALITVFYVLRYAGVPKQR